MGGIAWAIDWVLQFTWVSVLTGVATQIGNALQTSVVDRFGLAPTLLLVAAFVCGIWIVTGKIATGLGELAVSVLIAALATVYLTHPVSTLAGPNGLLPKAQQAGIEIGAGILGNSDASATPAALRQETTGTIITNFVRIPHQLLNYGADIDDTDPHCKAAYDAALVVGGETEGLITARSVLGHCNSAYKKYADNPGFGQLVSLAVLYPSALGLLLFAGLFVFALITAVVFLVFESLKLIVNAVVAIVPGVGRGALWQSLSGAAVALVMVVFCTVFLAGYMAVIRAIFAGTASWNVTQRFLLIDMVLFAGLVLFIVQRRKLRKAGNNMARKLASMKIGNGGKASQLPQRTPIGISQGLAQAASIRNGVRRGTAGALAAGAAGGLAAEALEHHNQRASFGARLAQSKAGRTGKFAVKSAAFAAKATVGAPVFAPRAAKQVAASTAKRANAVRARLQTAQAGAAAFTGEYTGNLAAASRGVGKTVAFASHVTGATAAGKAAGRASAPAVVAAVIAGSGRTRPGVATRAASKARSQQQAPRVPTKATAPVTNPTRRAPKVTVNTVSASPMPAVRRTRSARPGGGTAVPIATLPVSDEVKARRATPLPPVGSVTPDFDLGHMTDTKGPKAPPPSRRAG